jgi:hypothetical protein
MARAGRLRAADTRDVLVEPRVRVPATDGVDLVTDLYLPRLPGAADRRPTVLMRTPYGRQPPWSLMAAVLAERGYNVVLQSCRGTFGSGGSIDFAAEAADGRATADWIVAQRWSDGALGTFGPSYLSFVQWALASTRPPQLRAMAIQIMASDRRRSYYPGGSFALDTALSWSYLVSHQEELAGLARLRARAGQERALAGAFRHLPLLEADVVGVGRPAPLFREWLQHDGPGDPYWDPIDFRGVIPSLGVPVSIVGAWYDYYLPCLLEDHAALVQAGARVRLTVGPWPHSALGGMLEGVRQALAWFDVHLLGREERTPAAPVRVAVMGGGGWRDLGAWPPPSTRTVCYLHPGGTLGAAPPGPSEPDGFRYDPADPTPAVGGSSLSRNSGPRDNRELEARADVLTYTSPPLGTDLEVIGEVAADLFFSSSREHTDVFARLCDVAPSGRSTNVSDGLLRLRPGQPERSAGGVARVRVDLWPTAYRFGRGHRIRLQVSSGSHPRYARNPGSGEPLATATTLVAANQTVFHDAQHPSAVVLPLVGRRGPG